MLDINITLSSTDTTNSIYFCSKYKITCNINSTQYSIYVDNTLSLTKYSDIYHPITIGSMISWDGSTFDYI